MLKVEGHIDLYRDEDTKAIINKSDEYSKYLNQRALRISQSEEMKNMKSEISELKQMMSTLLELLNNR